MHFFILALELLNKTNLKNIFTLPKIRLFDRKINKSTKKKCQKKKKLFCTETASFCFCYRNIFR